MNWIAYEMWGFDGETGGQLPTIVATSEERAIKRAARECGLKPQHVKITRRTNVTDEDRPLSNFGAVSR